MVFSISYLSQIWFFIFIFWDIWVQFILGVCLCSSDLHGSICCCTSTKKLSSSVSIRSTRMGKRKGNSSPFHALFVSFLQLRIHKFCITLLIFLFRILFLCSLPNLAHFLSICTFLSKKSKFANQFCLFKISKNAFFFISFIEQILILGLPQKKMVIMASRIIARERGSASFLAQQREKNLKTTVTVEPFSHHCTT